MSETVSRLVDSELTEQELGSAIGDLASEEQSSRQWRNYHLIGNIMRGEGTMVGRDVTHNVASRLEQEPTVLAPAALPTRDGGVSDTWKPVTVFAMAASLALVAVITLVPGTGGSLDSQVAQVAQVEESDDEMFAKEFDEMLAEHGEFTASPGLNGLVAYAKLVSAQSLEQ